MSVEGLKKLSGGNNGVQWTTDRAAELPIHVSTDPNSPASAQPFTVPQMFQNTVNNYPDKVALRVEREGKWVEWTYTQYYNECRAFAKALIANGFQPHQGVSIIGFNAPEWHFADLGNVTEFH